MLTKRDFLIAGGAAGLAVGAPRAWAQGGAGGELPDLAAKATPISPEEHQLRIEKAQALMQRQGITALVIEAGSALTYFTGIRWWRSERFTGVVIPREGTPVVITPYFEEPSIRESVKVETQVRTWHENENPFALVAGALSDRGYEDGRIAIEETVRHFVSNGIAEAAPAFDLVSGMSVTRGVRMYKSPAELALMQVANDITLAAYKHIHPKVEPGMSQGEISAMMNEATTQLGGSVEFSMVLLNEASAYPHGTNTPQTVRDGSVILMDCGCGVHDYESDISRTWVFGEPTKKQRDVWNTVKAGQELALETAQLGVRAGLVDETVRAFYESKGYGPGYETPGLSHRLGHGIGMDGHEPVNFVEGEDTLLAPGMCFSNEPGIYIFGEFGVRLEDCLYMTEDGPKLFSPLSPSIDRPFG
ncbi:Xaa-Pro peptidase family protein [Henriciella sp.]|uniref:M24 family metallopeptidase n=1 Tax=Henriciella sp. TaxID=1968823 RepID=UPI00260B620E|nr:Xaa-Pro peptidase family protein [Henriciella sp.]